MPAVTRITKLNLRGHHPSRAAAIIFLIVCVAGILALFFTTGLPPVLRDLRQLSDDLPQRIPGIVAQLTKIPSATSSA
jgi:predicted PurR-regulated permease PerM